jgi:ATP-binding cassette, subfamily C, bacterial LapB
MLESTAAASTLKAVPLEGSAAPVPTPPVAVATNASTPPNPSAHVTHAPDPLLACIELVCELHGQPVPAHVLGSGLARQAQGRVDPMQVGDMMLAHGMSARFGERTLDSIPAFALPVVLLMQDGSACVLLSKPKDPTASAGAAPTAANKAGTSTAANTASILLPESGGAAHAVDWSHLQATYSGKLLYVKPRARLDARGDFDIKVSPTRWFWQILGRYKRYYWHVGLATVLVNVLTVAGALFTMIVYDRVVPNQAYNTLWVLAIGVAVAAVFEFGARMLRAWLTDIAGKKADIVMSSVLFRRVLGLRMDQRPGSAGSFANTLREFESVRDFVTSATLLTVADMPFVLMFIGLMAVIAGPLAFVPLLAMLFVVAVTLIAQVPMAKLMAKYMQGMSRKQSIAVEAIEGLEALKANQAESLMQSRWEASNAEMAAFSAKSRLINAWVLNTVNISSQLATVAVVVWGVYRIHDNLLTMGGLIAASILAGRAIAPVNQIAGLGLRWQQARTSLQGLNELMLRAQHRDPERSYVSAPNLSGAVSFQQVSHAYGQGQDAKPSLDRVSFQVRAGERVAVLGKVGSGKSTLLRIAAGLLPAKDGAITLDALDSRQIEPNDVRARVAYLGQDAALFHGTLKDNILLGVDHHVTAARLTQALRMTGLDRVVAAHPRGLELPIGEHGVGLSGGQRQLVALARLFVREPSLLLLDEPTSAMDNATEAQIMAAMRAWLQGRTMLMVTHRMQWVALADRVIVIDGGRIVADGPREQVLQQLSKGIATVPRSA